MVSVPYVSYITRYVDLRINNIIISLNLSEVITQINHSANMKIHIYDPYIFIISNGYCQ